MQVCSSCVFCSVHGVEETEQILQEPESGHVALGRAPAGQFLVFRWPFCPVFSTNCWSCNVFLGAVVSSSHQRGWMALPQVRLGDPSLRAGCVSCAQPDLTVFGSSFIKGAADADRSPPGAATLSPRL